MCFFYYSGNYLKKFFGNMLTLCQNGATLTILTWCQNKKRRQIIMKKNIGSKLALYPMPITVIGA